MGKQRLLLHVIFGALATLLLGQLLSAAEPSEPAVAVARLYDGPPPVYASGTVIRRETAVWADGPGDWMPRLEDGQKAAAGQTLFVLAPSAEQSAAALKVRLLRQGTASARQAPALRRANVHEAIASLAEAEDSGRKDAAERLTARMMAGSAVSEDRMEQAWQRLRSLSRDTAAVTAPEPGIFAAVWDGLEEVLTPETPWAEWSLPRSPRRDGALGRLILEDTWYFRTELPFAVEPGDRLDAVLLNGWDRPLRMTVEETRGSAVLLSCDAAMEAVAAVRQAEIKFLRNAEPGLEIPKKAVYTVEGAAGVWCLVGEAAVFKPVEIVAETDDTLVVALDQSDTANLWPGDEILLNYP